MLNFSVIRIGFKKRKKPEGVPRADSAFRCLRETAQTSRKFLEIPAYS
jgi:hypothetical protein